MKLIVLEEVQGMLGDVSGLRCLTGVDWAEVYTNPESSSGRKYKF